MKKALTVILSIIGSILVALLILILACLFNPGLSSKISALLYPDREESLEGVAGDAVSEGMPSTTDETDIFAVIDPALDASGIEKSYEPPVLTQMSVPEEMRTLSGYIPVKDEGLEVSDKEAEELREELGYGSLGEELNFDKIFYPYYHMLGDDLKELYRQIYANANDLNESFATIKTVSPTELKHAFLAVVNDHPELFFLNTAYAYKYSGNGTCEIELSFNETAGNIEEARESFEAAASDVVYDISGSDTDKELALHNRLIERISYDLDAPMNQSAYSALVSGKTVCAGYARAFQYLCQKLSIPCYYCTGYAGENHAWDIIKLDDGYYNVDVTWDDTDPSTYDYFNVSDSDIRANHLRKELSIYLPACNGEAHRQMMGESTDVVKRSLEEAGYGPEDVIDDVNRYYNKCYDILTEGEGEDAVFELVLSDKDLYDSVIGYYDSGGYKQAFMNRVMEENEIPFCTFNVTVEELEGGYFLLTHTFERGELETDSENDNDSDEE